MRIRSDSVDSCVARLSRMRARRMRLSICVLALGLTLAVLAPGARAAGSSGDGHPGWTPAFRCLAPGERDTLPAALIRPPGSPFERALQGLFRSLWRVHQRAQRVWRMDHCVRLNQVQVLGTHNSYKIQPADSLMQLLRLFLGPLADTLEYSHAPLAEQLESQGIRQIELDVFGDAAGGLFATPAGPRIVAAQGLPPGPENDPDGLLAEPGLKVLHIQDVDFRSTCLGFERCLQVVKSWSDDNPRHLPIMILVEAKDDPIPDPGFGFVVPEEIDAATLDEIDATIHDVFPAWQLITPDEVRGGRSTLEEAVRMGDWPTLAEARGRVLFALDNGGRVRDLYVAGHPSLAGRVMFTDSPPGSAEAAFLKINDPLPDPSGLRERVVEGYLVRTRADADTLEARLGDTTRRDTALASGAHYVSTDYPVENPDFGTGYVVAIPDGDPARCNPVNAPRDCRSRLLELPRRGRSDR